MPAIITTRERAKYETRLRCFRHGRFGLARFCSTARGVNLDPTTTRWLLDHDPRVERLDPHRGGWPTWRKKPSRGPREVAA